MDTMTGRRASGVALAFGIIAFAVPSATANPPGIAPHPHAPKAHSAVTGAHKATNAANNNAVVTTLHEAHALLAMANHDYAGHRAKAAESISHAIRELGGHHHHSHSTTLGAAHHIAAAIGGGGKVHEAQAQSDAQLQQAAKLLIGQQGHVPNTHKAATHIQHAINEINTALKIR